MNGRDAWTAAAAIATAIATITTLVVAIFTYQALVLTRATASASMRNDMLKTIDEAIVRFKQSPAQAQYLLLALRNVAENKRAKVLTPLDIAFINDYVTQEPLLCKNKDLLREWDRFQKSIEQSEELRALVSSILDEKRSC